MATITHGDIDDVIVDSRHLHVICASRGRLDGVGCKLADDERGPLHRLLVRSPMGQPSGHICKRRSDRVGQPDVVAIQGWLFGHRVPLLMDRKQRHEVKRIAP